MDTSQYDTSGTLASISDQNTYTNIHVKSTTDLMKKELKKVSGIYAIAHNDSNKIYVGSSMDLSKRIINHIENRSSNIHLQHAINKHGLSNFTVYVLDVLPTNDTLSLEDLSATLIKMEQIYLDLFNNKYNINPLAGKTRLGAKHTAASLELMSTWRKENPSFLGKTHSPEVLKQIREIMEGSNNPMYGKPVTDSTRKMISELFSKPVFLYDANTFKLISKYDKHKDILDDLKISPKTLVKYKDSGLVFRDKYILSSIELG
jgi:group I intron endonuclease